MTGDLVALILGAGPRIGTAVGQKFASKGYKVAIASRSGTGAKTEDGFLSLKADFTKPDSVPALFDAVKAEDHTAPNVVIYNAAGMTIPSKADSLFSIPGSAVTSDLNINTVSAYVAAPQAVSAWGTLPTETMKTFVYTGNILNITVLPVPAMVNLGSGKAASAYWIGVADATYSARGFRSVIPKYD